jgi:hypothetical protein
MIEIDGRAIPLEPGKHYILLFNENLVPDSVIIDVKTWCEEHDIDVFIAVVHNPAIALRVVSVEVQETIEVPK